MTKPTKVVVLLSGGVDSSTCLSLAVDEYGSNDVSCLIEHYGQRHEKEIEHARAVADYYGVPRSEMDLSGVMKWSDCPLLKESGSPIAHKSYAEQIADGETHNGIVSTYVPFRNGLFLAAAAAFAYSVGADIVMYGAHADDAAGNAYPDCSEEFAKAMDTAIREGTGGKVRLVAPFVDVDKAEVVRRGLQLGTPYHLTWSCYEGGDKPCGECGTCIDRAGAFAANGVKDPALE